MIALLSQVARHGRLGLVLGLGAGLLLPDLAQVLRPYLPQMIGVLLALTALRIGPRAAFGSLAELRGTATAVFVFQLAMPLSAFALFGALGLLETPVALVTILLFAAPSLTGNPNFAILLGQPPAPALRILVLGTALFPVTVLPIFWLLPTLSSPLAALTASFTLLAVITISVTLGFTLRTMMPRIKPEAIQALDGLSVIMLAIIVVALMSALGPALRSSPSQVALWLALTCALNFGAQFTALKTIGKSPLAIISGNRNIALFLIALPPEITEPLLIFVGCYQIPMYLTPILMQRFYRGT